MVDRTRGEETGSVRDRLKRIDVAGAAVQDLAGDASYTRGSWNADGTVLFSRPGGLYRVAATGGTPSVVVPPSHDEEFFSEVSFLPDGRHFLVLRRRWDRSWSELHVGALDTTETHALLSGTDLSAPQYAPPFLLFMRGDRLQAQRFDVATLKLSGEPLPVAEQVSHNSNGPGQGFAAMSVSATGVLAYRSSAR